MGAFGEGVALAGVDGEVGGDAEGEEGVVELPGLRRWDADVGAALEEQGGGFDGLDVTNG